MQSVAAVGECMLELSRDGDGWRMGYAGDTFNTLWTLRACLPPDWTADYVSAFGDDPFSAGQMRFLAEAGIGTAASPIVAGARPGLYAITLDAAERSFTYWRSDSAARRLADDEAALAASLVGRSLVFFSGITLAILEAGARETLLRQIEAARRNGALVAFDPNYRPRLWQSPDEARSTMADASRLADIALPTFGDEALLFGDASPADTVTRVASFGVGEIAVKNGSEPALVGAGGSKAKVVPPEVKAIDTTGAGDGFNGGYLAARLLGHFPKEAARRGHATAAATIMVRGALAPTDTLRTAFVA